MYSCTFCLILITLLMIGLLSSTSVY